MCVCARVGGCECVGLCSESHGAHYLLVGQRTVHNVQIDVTFVPAMEEVFISSTKVKVEIRQGKNTHLSENRYLCVKRYLVNKNNAVNTVFFSFM